MYAKIQNQNVIEYPYTITQLRNDNPYTSFTQNPTESELKDFDVVHVKDIDKPVVEYMQSVTEVTPIKVEETWYQTWQVTTATEQEISNRLALKASDIRSQRNVLLTQSDWTQVADAPVNQQVWATYRQALRDITQQPGFPLEITWPTQPQ